MNANDIVRYGHGTVLRAVEAATDAQWEQPGACGVWSIKNIVAHLAAYEQVLVALLTEFVDGDPATFQNPMTEGWNDREVALRSALSPHATLAEYAAACDRVMALLAEVPPEVLRRPGTLPWYGMEYALDDFIVYAFYGHKREHSAQIDHFCDQPAPAA